MEPKYLIDNKVREKISIENCGVQKYENFVGKQ